MEPASTYAISTLAAIVLGPILAVVVTRFIDARTERKRRKFDVFRNLMQTRGIRLDPVHVAALNILEIEFFNEAAVRVAYKSYIEHLSSPMPAVNEQDRFFDQRADLFMSLLYEIGKVLRFQFDKRDLERLSYVPQGWDVEQNLQRRNAQMLNQLLSGERPLPVSNFLSQASPYPVAPEVNGDDTST